MADQAQGEPAKKPIPPVVITEALGLRFFVPTGDTAIARSLVEFGEFARPEVDLCAALMERLASGWMLDVGANLGTISLPLAKAFPQWRFAAFEPQAAIFRLLAANATLNGLEHVALFPWCVGEKPGIVDFPAPPIRNLNSGAVGRDFKSPNTLPALMIALDNLKLDPVRLLKIDVEGFDLEVLQGASAVLKAQRPAVLFESKAGKKTEAAIALLRELDYRLYWFFAPFVTAKNRRNKPLPKGGMTGDLNALALPKGMDNPWPMPEIGDPAEDWRQRQAEFGYLSRYF